MPRRRRVARRAEQTYCGYTDDGGYCCTSNRIPGVFWCEAHHMMNERGMLPSIWTNQMTAEASEKALASAGSAGVNISGTSSSASPYISTSAHAGFPTAPATLPLSYTPPAAISPPVPPVPLGTAIKGFLPFKFISDHYGTEDWVAEVIARPAGKSMVNQKKLAEYIVSKIGIDVGDALDNTSDGKDMKLNASAGVPFADVVSEIAAREYLWAWHPYIQAFVLHSIAAGTSADVIRANKLKMIDAMCDAADGVKETYESLFGRARLRIDALGLSIDELKKDPKPKLLADPSPVDIATDVLRGKVSELASKPELLSLPTPDISDMREAIKRIFDRVESLKSKMYCGDAGTTTFEKTCSDWVISKVASMTTIPRDLSEYVEYANHHIPEFVSMFK